MGHFRNFKNKHFRGDHTLVKILHYISYLNCAHFIFIVISKLNILNIGFQDKLKSRLVCTSSLLLSIKVCKRLQSTYIFLKKGKRRWIKFNPYLRIGSTENKLWIFPLRGEGVKLPFRNWIIWELILPRIFKQSAYFDRFPLLKLDTDIFEIRFFPIDVVP